MCRANNDMKKIYRLPDHENLPKCGYLHHFDPYLRLGPFKVEIILRSPYLSILHELLTEEEIQVCTLCQHTMGGFQRAGTGKNKKVIEISSLLAFWPERT